MQRLSVHAGVTLLQTVQEEHFNGSIPASLLFLLGWHAAAPPQTVWDPPVQHALGHEHSMHLCNGQSLLTSQEKTD